MATSRASVQSRVKRCPEPSGVGLSCVDTHVQTRGQEGTGGKAGTAWRPENRCQQEQQVDHRD